MSIYVYINIYVYVYGITHKMADVDVFCIALNNMVRRWFLLSMTVESVIEHDGYWNLQVQLTPIQSSSIIQIQWEDNPFPITNPPKTTLVNTLR